MSATFSRTNQWLSVAVALLVLAAIAGISQVMPTTASGASLAAPAESLERSRDASAARLQAYGEALAASQAENLRRSRDVAAARLQAAGEAYSARQADSASAIPNVDPGPAGPHGGGIKWLAK